MGKLIDLIEMPKLDKIKPAFAEKLKEEMKKLEEAMKVTEKLCKKAETKDSEIKENVEKHISRINPIAKEIDEAIKKLNDLQDNMAGSTETSSFAGKLANFRMALSSVQSTIKTAYEL